jgi:pimeloyl-ACP methyl ester carboxylesterase
MASKRLKNADCLMNHFLAGGCSEELVRHSSKNIHVPTLIFQGSEEPVFGPDHGTALAHLIPKSEYVLVKGMGHVPTPHFEGFIIDKLIQHILQDRR